MNLRHIALACYFAFALIAKVAAATGPPSAVATVAWLEAQGDAHIENAFTRARSENKPLLLYWGASWCPPCNQLKATLFNRQDFIAQSRNFVAVHLDGDIAGAQRLGKRFNVRGYPTLILFSPEGFEITRLPGEADAPQILNLLQLGLAGGRPIKQVLTEARSGQTLSANEWRLLAYYSWETDEQQLVAQSQLAGLLQQLAVASTGVEIETTTRLWLKALAASGQRIKPDAALQKRVHSVLKQASQARAHMDVLINGAVDIVRAMAPQRGQARSSLLAEFDLALRRLQNDNTLSRADRISALQARVDLARIDQAKNIVEPIISPALVAEAKQQAWRADRDISDGYERQAVISSAAYLLGQAGAWEDSDGLLKANLSRSPSPYYLMSQLGGNARKQGNSSEALQWYESAFRKSEGPATRLQWGATYFTALVELDPQDVGRIERLASQLLREAGQDQSAFYERSARSLQKVGALLSKWSADGRQTAMMGRLRLQLDGICGKIDAADKQRATCDNLIKIRQPV